MVRRSVPSSSSKRWKLGYEERIPAKTLVEWMRPRLSARTCIGFAAGLAVGACLGQLDALGVDDAQATPVPSPAPAPQGIELDSDSEKADLETALMESWSSSLRLAARVNSLEALVEAMSAPDVSQAVQSSISQMSERELESVLASMIHLSREEIEEVGDLRAFANRLAEIAMEDTLMPTDTTAEGGHVVFTTSPERDEARGQFDAGESRIYAVFPTDYFDQEKVMVKWYRRDNPEILLLQRYPIVAGDQYGHVWLEPNRGWEQGQYKVDIYAGDETMGLLASGNYSVQ